MPSSWARRVTALASSKLHRGDRPPAWPMIKALAGLSQGPFWYVARFSLEAPGTPAQSGEPGCRGGREKSPAPHDVSSRSSILPLLVAFKIH